MTKTKIALSIALMLAVTSALPGCHRDANLTEQERIQRAKDFEDKGNLKGSIVELKNAIGKNPNSPQARLLLGQIYLKAGLGAEAEKELTKAEKLGVNHETIQIQLGEALLLMGENKRVLDEIQVGSQTSKINLARIQQIRADALLNQGKLKDAYNLFQQSLNTDANNPRTYWGLARCAVAEHDTAKAKASLESALKINDGQAKTWVYLGDLEQLNSHVQGALDAYTKALQVEPNNLDALERRVNTYLSLGQVEPARKDLDRVVKAAPKSISANYLKALFNFQQKKYSEARDNLQEVFNIAPEHIPSTLLAGMTNYALGSYQQAESYLNRFLTQSPNYPPALNTLAAMQIRQGQPDNALQTLSPLLSSGTKDAEALALAGEAYLKKNKATTATEFFERAATLEPTNATIQTRLGLSSLSAGNTQLAISELEVASAMDRNQLQADTLLVLTFINHEEYDKALAAIDRMEVKLPHNPVSSLLRGKAYLGKNDRANARKSFEQALAIDPTYLQAAASLAQIDLQEGKPESARKRFENILEKNKNSASAMMALAGLSALTHDEKGYEDWLLRASKANPMLIKPRSDLVRHYLAKGENKKALELANGVANDHPDSLSALNLLGVTQLAIGDKTGAITTFTRITQKAPQLPSAFLDLALAQIAQKRPDKARISLQQAIKLNPAFVQALDTLMSLELVEKRADAALQIARQIQSQQPKSPLGFDREADILLSQKRFPQAVKVYEQAMERGAGSAELIKLYRALNLAGDSNGADQRLATWIKQNPKDITTRTYAAEYYMASNRDRDAIAQYEAILMIGPQNALALNNLAGLYQREKDSRALTTAEQAYRLAPNLPSVQDTLGWILLEQGQLPRAMDLLGKAAAATPRVAAIHYHYGVGLARVGKKAEAKKEIEAAIAAGQQFAELEEAKTLLKGM